MKSTCIAILLCATLGSATGQAAKDEAMTARDLFWSGADKSDVRPNAAQSSGAVANAAGERNNSQGEAGASRPGAASGQPLTATRVTELGYGTAPRMEPSATGLLGLRYTMLQRDATSGEYSEVLPSKTFHAGDRVRLSIMPNQPGYLYIIQQGTSGDWSSLFPRDSHPTERERLAGGHLYGFPPEENSSFQFDRRAGTERLFLVFMRSAATGVDEVMSTLRPPTEHHHSTTTAPNMVSDNVCPAPIKSDAPASRDLVITTVGSQGGQTSMEKAVYVVNRVSATDKDARIVACLTITHE